MRADPAPAMARAEARLLVTAALATWIFATIAVAGVGAALCPVFVAGRPSSLDPLRPTVALAAGVVVGCATGVAACAVLVGRDFDSGTRRHRIALGASGPRLAMAQLLVAVVGAIAAMAATVLVGWLAGLADLGRRTLAGDPITPRFSLGASPVDIIAAVAFPGVLTVVVAATVVAVGSGRRGILLLGGLLASWLVLLPTIRGGSAEDWVGVHPVALPWSRLSPLDTIKLTYDGSSWITVPTFLAWVVLLLVGAIRGSRRPG